MRSHLQFLELLSGEVWRFLTPWLIKEGQLRLRGGIFFWRHLVMAFAIIRYSFRQPVVALANIRNSIADVGV